MSTAEGDGDMAIMWEEKQLPKQEEANAMYDRIPMVKVNGKLYYDTGQESAVGGRCGNMDETIKQKEDVVK